MIISLKHRKGISALCVLLLFIALGTIDKDHQLSFMCVLATSRRGQSDNRVYCFPVQHFASFIYYIYILLFRQLSPKAMHINQETVAPTLKLTSLKRQNMQRKEHGENR